MRRLRAEEVPVIDAGPLVDATDPERVGAELARAATDIGFIYVANHGIGSATIARAREAALEFFALPETDKQAVAVNRHHHGYLGPGSTRMHDDAETDVKESFNWGLEWDAEPPNPLVGPNRWPGAAPGLRAALMPFFEAASACAVMLLRGFALGLSKPPELFVQHRDRPLSRGSLQHYPPASPAGGRTSGVAEHTDFGVVTVLSQDSVGGLEIELPGGEWVAVPPIEGALVVNVGDLLERWSNGRFRSTPHRVRNRTARQRLSLVLAYDPNFETPVDPGAVCRPGEQPRYEPISCGDYLMWRFRRAFDYRSGLGETQAAPSRPDR